MQNLIYLAGVVLAAVVLHLFLPWYAIAAAGLIVGLALPARHAGAAFLLGLLAGGLVWGVYAGYLNHFNGGLLATRIGAMLGGVGPGVLVLLTALLGGLSGGLGAMTGTLGRRLLTED